MQRIAWIIACCVLLGGFVWYYSVVSESTQSNAEFSELLEKERQQQTHAIKQQVADSSEQKRRESAERVTVRPAIPELPEYSWDATRAWNLPLNNPAVVSVADSFFLEPDDYVVGVLLGRRARAYPWFVLANYHAINDHIGSKPVIVTLCEACNGGAAFLANTEHTTIDVRPFGIKNGTWYAIDFQTGSHWYPFIGEAFDGPLKGTKLKRIRTYFSTWRQWARDHPETTVVLSSDEVRDRPHGRMGHMANDQTFNPEILARLATSPPNPKSDLLPASELIFGLIPEDDAAAIAYSLASLRRAESPLQTKIGELPIVLFVQNQYQVGAYVRRIGDEELQLQLDSKDPWLMVDQFGSKWDAWGRTVSGPSHPAELPVADGYLTKWYEWLENFPETQLIADKLP